MYLKMTRKCFLISLLIFPQYLTSVQSSAFNESQLNKLSDEVLISGWNPFLDKSNKRLIELGSVKVDLSKNLIFKDKKEYKINNTEKTILEFMINSPGKSFSREEIGKIIKLDKERSIDVIITRLRKKIEKDPKNPKFLQTLRGEGYVLWIELIF